MSFLLPTKDQKQTTPRDGGTFGARLSGGNNTHKLLQIQLIQPPRRVEVYQLSSSDDDHQYSEASQERGASRNVIFSVYVVRIFRTDLRIDLDTLPKALSRSRSLRTNLVLIIFMGGMAIGSWLAARCSSQWRNLLFAYAIIEALIGLCALSFHGIFTNLTAFAYAHVLPSLPSIALANVFKWSLAAALTLPVYPARNDFSLNERRIVASPSWGVWLNYRYALFHQQYRSRCGRSDKWLCPDRHGGFCLALC